jgi:hypothetical protein
MLEVCGLSNERYWSWRRIWQAPVLLLQPVYASSWNPGKASLDDLASWRRGIPRFTRRGTPLVAPFPWEISASVSWNSWALIYCHHGGSRYREGTVSFTWTIWIIVKELIILPRRILGFYQVDLRLNDGVWYGNLYVNCRPCGRRCLQGLLNWSVFFWLTCLLGRGHTILTSRELMWCYECSWDI